MLEWCEFLNALKVAPMKMNQFKQPKVIRLVFATGLGLFLLLHGGVTMAFSLTSSAFTNQSTIPSLFSCDGEDISPELSWADPPAGTKSFVLIMDDPDAPMGTWDHWLLFNIPADTRQLSQDVQHLPAGTLAGKNSWGRDDYGGPCPPDREHRYYFKLYALDTTLNLPDGTDKKTLLQAIKEHILGETELMGKYERKPQ